MVLSTIVILSPAVNISCLLSIDVCKVVSVSDNASNSSCNPVISLILLALVPPLPDEDIALSTMVMLSPAVYVSCFVSNSVCNSDTSLIEITLVSIPLYTSKILMR